MNARRETQLKAEGINTEKVKKLSEDFIKTLSQSDCTLQEGIQVSKEMDCTLNEMLKRNPQMLMRDIF